MIPTKAWSSLLDTARQVDRLRQEQSPRVDQGPLLGDPKASGPAFGGMNPPAGGIAPLNALSPALRRGELERQLGALKSLLLAAGMGEHEIDLDLGAAPKTLRQNLLALLHRGRRSPPPPAFETALSALQREHGGLEPDQAQQVLGRAFLTELNEAPYFDRPAAERLSALLRAMDAPLRAAVSRLDQAPSEPALAEIARGVRSAIEQRGNACAAFLALLDPAALAELRPLFRSRVEARNQAQCQMLAQGRFDDFELSRRVTGGPKAFPDQHYSALCRYLESLPERDTRVSSVEGTIDALVYFRDTTAQPGWTHGYLLGAAHSKGPGPTQFQAVVGRLVDRWLEQGRAPELADLAAREGTLLEAEPFRGATYFRFAERLDLLEVLYDKGIISDAAHAERLKRIVAQRLPEARGDRWVNMWQGNILRIMERHPDIDFSALPGVRRELLGGEDLRRIAGQTARPAVADAARAPNRQSGRSRSD